MLEALTGFGAPVAICSALLIALGFEPIKAAAVALLANTAPVPFGAIGTPVVTLSGVTGLPPDQLAAIIGRQTPVLALFVPLILVFVIDGRRGVREVWPLALVVGASFAIGQFLCSNFGPWALTDIVASLISLLAAVVVLRVWQPTNSASRRDSRSSAPAPRGRRARTGRDRDGVRAVRHHRCRLCARPIGPGEGTPRRSYPTDPMARPRHDRCPQRSDGILDVHL